MLDPLAGCVVETTAHPSRWRLLSEPLEREALLECPGVEPEKYGASDGTLIIPDNMVRAPRGGLRLEDYEPDACEETPIGGLKLYDHQRRSVTFLRQVDDAAQGAYLAADPGAGKTAISLQSLWLDGLLDQPGLVVAPLQATGTWCSEDSDATRYFGLRLKPLEGLKTPDFGAFEDAKHVFIHYDILAAWMSWLAFYHKPVWVIFDEVHYLFNSRAKRSEEALNLSRAGSIRRRYALSGTPVPKHRIDLWHQLAIVQPHQWNSQRWQFCLRFCSGQRLATREGGGRLECNGISHNDELLSRLSGVLLRYTKNEIAQNLPELVRERIDYSLTPDQLKEYKRAELNIARYLRDEGKLKVREDFIEIDGQIISLGEAHRKPGGIRLVLLTTLIGLLSNFKRTVALQWVDRLLQQHKHVVVFCWRRETAEWLCEQNRLITTDGVQVFGPVEGGMAQKKRQTAADGFAASEKGLFIATLGAASVSMNQLKVASCVLFVDLWWNPATIVQAEARVHREGAKAERIESYFIVAKGTADEHFLDKLKEKSDQARSVASNDVAGADLVGDLDMLTGSSDSSGIDEFLSRLLSKEQSLLEGE